MPEKKKEKIYQIQYRLTNTYNPDPWMTVDTDFDTEEDARKEFSTIQYGWENDDLMRDFRLVKIKKSTEVLEEK